MTTMMQLIRRRRITSLLLMAVVGVFCLQCLTAPNYSMDGYSVDFHYGGGEGEHSAEETMEDETRFFRRFLMDPSGVGGGEVYEGEEDYDVAAALALGDDAPPQDPAPLRPYAMEDALAEFKIFNEGKIFNPMFCIVVYDPQKDAFVGLFDEDRKRKAVNKKLFRTLKHLAYMLRRTFPERFAGPGSSELVLAIGGGDYPHVRRSKLPHTDGVAPVLMFGSSFRDPAVYPNMIAMPMPAAQHLDCFEEWLTNANEQVCKELRAKTPGSFGNGKLVFGEEYGLEWDKLIPQLVWRGTDFNFLRAIQSPPSLVRPDSSRFVPAGEDEGDKRADAVRALMDSYDTLVPRWKGVALTAEAELQAEEEALPWANMKFASYPKGRKSGTSGSPTYGAWESVGIGAGKGIWAEKLAEYRYHIDLGGGGGTTWSGTVEKLAMPGLLFHHVTPMKDYVHDRLTPWRHYVPVRSDLMDLKAKFDWAESHPREAKRIADAGTEFMRRLGTAEGFGRMFEEDFVGPLRRVIDAYQPVSIAHSNATSWENVLRSAGNGRVIPVVECSGRKLEKSCQFVGGDEVAEWSKGGSYS